ncbi:hypothetical protein RRG08_065780 [Elysia crispata]|uniref:Uncharacterized protein n=1 Tax=Elysia crispata TaxID=231223 RepID=A0AAE1DKI7_9GAST|nr:hypothetical protein RRG08_065780 [Elysia crispata]
MRHRINRPVQCIHTKKKEKKSSLKKIAVRQITETLGLRPLTALTSLPRKNAELPRFVRVLLAGAELVNLVSMRFNPDLAVRATDERIFWRPLAMCLAGRPVDLQ